MCTTLYYLLANLQITKKSYLLASVPNWKCVAFKSLVCCLHSARFLALEACPWFFCQKLAKFRILHNTINSNIFQDRLKYKFFQSFEVYQLSFFKFLEQNQNCWDDFIYTSGWSWTITWDKKNIFLSALPALHVSPH